MIKLDGVRFIHGVARCVADTGCAAGVRAHRSGGKEEKKNTANLSSCADGAQ